MALALCEDDVDTEAMICVLPGLSPPLGALGAGVVEGAGVGVEVAGAGFDEVGVEETGSDGRVRVGACGIERILIGVVTGATPPVVRAVPSGVTISSPVAPVPAADVPAALVPPVSGRLKSAPKAPPGRSELPAGARSLTVTTAESLGAVWLASGQLTPARRWPRVMTAAAKTPVATTTEAANSTRRRDMWFNIGKNGLQHKGCQSFVH